MSNIPNLEELLDYGEEYPYPDSIISDYFRLDSSKKQNNNSNQNSTANQNSNQSTEDNLQESEESEKDEEPQEYEDSQEQESSDKTSNQGMEQRGEQSTEDSSQESEADSSEKDEDHSSNEKKSNKEVEEKGEEQSTEDSSQESEADSSEKNEDQSSNGKESNKEVEENSEEQSTEDSSQESEADSSEKDEDQSSSKKESNKEVEENSEEQSTEGSSQESEADSSEKNEDQSSNGKESNKEVEEKGEEQSDSQELDENSDTKSDDEKENNDFDDLMDNYDEENHQDSKSSSNSSGSHSASNKLSDVTTTQIYRTLKKLVSISYEKYQKGTYKYNKKEVVKHYLTNQKFRIMDDLISPTFKPDVYVFDLSPSNDESLEMYVNAISSVAIKGSLIYLTYNETILRKLEMKKSLSKGINVHQVANNSVQKYNGFDCTIYDNNQTLYEELKDINDRKIYVFSDFDISSDISRLSQENSEIVWFSTEKSNYGSYGYDPFFHREYPTSYIGYYVETSDIKDIEKFISEKNKNKYKRRPYSG